jgi:hypothetical protein
MKYKPTAKFKELTIEKDYQNLTTAQYWDFKDGKTVDLPSPPEHLIKGGYIEAVEKKKSKKSNKKD